MSENGVKMMSERCQKDARMMSRIVSEWCQKGVLKWCHDDVRMMSERGQKDVRSDVRKVS